MHDADKREREWRNLPSLIESLALVVDVDNDTVAEDPVGWMCPAAPMAPNQGQRECDFVFSARFLESYIAAQENYNQVCCSESRYVAILHSNPSNYYTLVFLFHFHEPSNQDRSERRQRSKCNDLLVQIYLRIF